jgi:competence protein ComEC
VLASAGAHGVPVDDVSAGTAYAGGKLRLTVVGPVHELNGTRSDPNNNSVVLRATYGGHSVLLAGDAEGEEQRTLLDPHRLHADVLKVAHHGSAYQDVDFLAAVDPLAALVSVGAGNDYGHPNAALLARLARSGTRVARTDQDGDLAVTDDGGRLAVVVRGVDPGRRPR